MKKVFLFLGALILSTSIWAEPITVRLKASSLPSKWGEVCIWYWGDETPSSGKWPGEKLTEVDGWYTKTFKETTTSISIIWNNNDNGKQTVDIADVQTSTCYEITGGAGTKHTVAAVSCPGGADKYFAKNNWDGGKWEWREMTAAEDDIYYLDSVVFGGTGVNINTKADDAGSAWFPVDSILVYGADTLLPLDTVMLMYDAENKRLRSNLIGRPAPVVKTYYLMGGYCEWNFDAAQAFAMVNDTLTVTIDSLFGEIKITEGKSWDVNYGAWGEAPYELHVGASPYGLKQNGGQNFKFDADYKNAVFQIFMAEKESQQVLHLRFVSGEKVVAPEPEVQYFAKNNWDGGEWAWKKMTKTEEVYQLDSVVFGGTGININTKAEDKDALWFALADIKGDSIAANDTIALVFHPADSSLTAALIGRPVPPTPVYYITGDSALVGELAWKADALKMANDSNHTFMAMAAGDYKMKVTNGAWEPEGKSWGFANLTAASSEGLSGDADGNICFTVETANNVVVKFANDSVTVTGNFKKPQPVIYDTLTLYADSVWASDGAKIAAWVWGEGVTSQWTAFFAGEELVLTAAFPENATGIKFVRFADYVQAPDWNAGEGIWGQTGDETIDNCLTYYANGYASPGVLAGQWCSVPTALDNLNDNRNDNGKFILNGQLYIIRNGMTFDAQGKMIR